MPDPLSTQSDWDRMRLIAKRFHEVYEDVAEAQGWSTQEASRVPFEELPDANRATMMLTVGVLLQEGVIR